MTQIFTSKTDEWGTPQKFFNELDREFNFTLDPCGTLERPLKTNMLTWDIRKGKDGLLNSWRGHNVFINPPYSQKNVELWCEKIYKERNEAKMIVVLIPVAKSSTKYFHKYIYPYAEIRLVEGRLKFIPLLNQKESSNPMGSMLCIMRGGCMRTVCPRCQSEDTVQIGGFLVEDGDVWKCVDCDKEFD